MTNTTKEETEKRFEEEINQPFNLDSIATQTGRPALTNNILAFIESEISLARQNTLRELVEKVEGKIIIEVKERRVKLSKQFPNLFGDNRYLNGMKEGLEISIEVIKNHQSGERG